MTSTIDFQAINAAALRSARFLLPTLIPGGKFRSLEYIARNPRRADQNPGSFSVNYKTGIWKDFACEDGGGDLISLAAFAMGVSQGDAARELANKLGVPLSMPNGHAANGHRQTGTASDPSASGIDASRTKAHPAQTVNCAVTFTNVKAFRLLLRSSLRTGASRNGTASLRDGSRRSPTTTNQFPMSPWASIHLILNTISFYGRKVKRMSTVSAN